MGSEHITDVNIDTFDEHVLAASGRVVALRAAGT